MALSLDKIRLSVPDNVLTRAVDGTTVVLDVDTGRSFTLDDIGSRVWSLLTTTSTANDALEALVHEYKADPAQVRADVEQLIEQLTRKALLTIVHV